MNETYIELARAVMELILAEAGDEAELLRGQYDRAAIGETKMYPCGFDMAFLVDVECPVSEDKTERMLGTVEVSLPGLERGMGFILWIKNGRLHSLEGYSYEEILPKEAKNYRLNIRPL